MISANIGNMLNNDCKIGGYSNTKKSIIYELLIFIPLTKKTKGLDF